MRSFGSGTRIPTLAAVLDLVREREPVSRVELAGATGLTQATMTHAVRKLTALGFVREVGTVRPPRGTPRRLLGLVPDACFMVGFQFDRYCSVGVVVDLAGRILARRELEGAGDREPGEVVAELAEAVGGMLEEAGVAREKTLGVGVATYGPQDRDAGVLQVAQPTPAWLDYPLAARLSEATGLPVALENDATAAGVGVLDDASSNFAVVFMSGGIGAGVIIDGYPYRGATSNGVELGHISVDALGPECGCGNRGCLDTVAGPHGVTALAAERPGLAARLALGEDALDGFRRIARAALDGDGDAEELIGISTQRLSIATLTLVNLFDVSRVVLAGPAFAEIGAVYRDALQEVLDKAVFMRHVHSVRADLAEDVSLAAPVGGAMVVLRNLLESPEAGRPGRGLDGPAVTGPPPPTVGEGRTRR